MGEKVTSPPRILRPSRPSPSVREREIDETPAIAATPSAMQARNTPKPLRPPRSSRRARRSTSGRAGRRGLRGGAGMVPCMASGGALPGLALEVPEMEAQRPVAADRKLVIVGDEHERRAALALQREQQLDDLLA